MFCIAHKGQTVKYPDYVEHQDTYEASNHDRSLVFTGTYTQCLIYIGAINMGKAPLTARNFALGIYR